MTKSLVTFIRKQLKVKGTSAHNGRGAWWCQADKSNEEILNQVKALLPRWRTNGLVLDVVETDSRIEVLFSPTVFRAFERLLVVDKTSRLYAYAIAYTDPGAVTCTQSVR